MLKTKKVLLTSVVVSAMLFVCTVATADLAQDLKNQGIEHNVEINNLLERDVPSAEIGVHVNAKTLQLAGFVENKQQYRDVGLISAKYADKYKVINNVRVLSSNGGTSEDAKLKKNIRDELIASKYPLEDIDVQVRNGHVILSGFVDKHVSLIPITKMSSSVPGVKTVENYIQYYQA